MDEYGRIIGRDGLCHCLACERWRAAMPDVETLEQHLARLTAGAERYREIGSRRAARFIWEAGDLEPGRDVPMHDTAEDLGPEKTIDDGTLSMTPAEIEKWNADYDRMIARCSDWGPAACRSSPILRLSRSLRDPVEQGVHLLLDPPQREQLLRRHRV